MRSNGADWRRPTEHTTTLVASSASLLGANALLQRVLDDDGYVTNVSVAVHATAAAPPSIDAVGPHAYRLSAGRGGVALSGSVAFAPSGRAALSPSFEEAMSASAAAWEAFWMSGGAVDFAGSSDGRAADLEGRLVMSQWAARAHEAGSLPPAETGLTGNSWYARSTDCPTRPPTHAQPT